MGIQPNRALTGGSSRSGGLLGLVGSWFSSKPAAAAPSAKEPSVQDLLDRLSLASNKGNQTALTDPAALQAVQLLRTPGQAARVTPAGWEALARQYKGLSTAARTQLTAQLKSAGVNVEMGADARYVNFSASGLRVIAEPSSNRIRRTQGDTTLCYEGANLAVAMKTQGDRVEVTTRTGTQTWVGGVGQGYQDGLPVTPRFATPVPGEAARTPWPAPLSDDLVEPAWNSDTRMSEYGPAYDDAIEATGGTVVQPTNAATKAADLFNCHSYATTGGQGDLFDPFLRETHPHWLNNPMYRLTNGPFAQLQDWQQVHPGDVVVYRKDGVVTHTGVVREVDADGNPTRIESKFGTLGLYEHEPFDVPAQYGEPAEFFRPDQQP